MKIEKNRVVTLSYQLSIKNEQGEKSLIETADKENPMAFIYGMSGLPEQFEDQLSGLSAGDNFDFKLEAEEGYGEQDENAIVDLPKSSFEIEGAVPADMLEVGNFIPMTDSEGNQLQGRVAEVTEDTVKMDFNHPLAGKELYFSGKVENVREATPDELSHGHVHGEGGVHH
ncbi:peptidylprolyl isomerase [Pontibacter korlensis]|uniref:Peptidyl-prolyl cis-trans isomerase n=1 Tax=Pontibacter korlensis TaxID=400092 RepID=A0A0E3UY16_9BACT|nr:peptidylprolyl isomerase [Pontibacter korlensis]AKD04742.1 peptidylprolyl isomerase [Pontibacter korlensis]